MKVSIIAIISLVLVACKSVPKKSSEENLTQIADSLAYSTQIADTTNNAHDTSTNVEMTVIKDNHSEDVFEITKVYEPTEQIVITKNTKHFKIHLCLFKKKSVDQHLQKSSTVNVRTNKYKKRGVFLHLLRSSTYRA